MNESLTSVQRLNNRLKGDPVDRVPNFDIIMGFGAHFIKAPLSKYYLDYHTLVRANIAILEAFDLDIVQAISDPYREAVDFGLEVEFPEDGLPRRIRPLLLEENDLNRLRIPDPYTGLRMSDRLEGVRLLHQKVGHWAPVMGWVEGALAQANALRGDAVLMTDFYDRPQWVRELLEICTQLEIAFARAQIEAGADIIGLGDAMASQISPSMYRKYALPYEQRIFTAVRQMGAIPRLHICGDTTKLLPYMAESGADIIDVDYPVDFRAATQELARHNVNGISPAICGNMDPVQVFFRGSPTDVYQATLDCLQAGGPRCFNAAGCEIPDGTPTENLLAQRRAIDFFGNGPIAL